ncbi:MAG TPA: hypothetical protein VK137_20605, partial [Planctomycetaceae bacterium]|nr:hypothetical protein [Planctomycetaceae bacterium]
TVTLAEGFAQPPEVVGEVLRQSRRARQWQILTRGVQPPAVESLRLHESVAEVAVRHPNLEEIFTAYMTERGDATTNLGSRAASAPGQYGTLSSGG